MTSVLVKLKEVHLGADEEVRSHRCIHKRIYSIFRSDVDARVSEGFGFLDEAKHTSECQHQRLPRK